MLSSNKHPSTTDAATAIATKRGDIAPNTLSPIPKPKRPKRPLSGYNLFYRFKRNKVVEATARLRRGGGSAVTPEEEKRVVELVLRALPGLESVPPDHAAWTLPAPALNELRAGNIRRTMEGRLLPDENARGRLHRKVHGMGFVEMGRAMREAWKGADGFTKRVFDELAGVSRARYRTLFVEYKLRGISEREPPITPASFLDNKNRIPQSSLDSMEPLTVSYPRRGRLVPTQPVDCPSHFADFSRSSSNGSAYQDVSNMLEQYLKNAVIPPPRLVTPGLGSSYNGGTYQGVNNAFEQCLESAVIPPPPLVNPTLRSTMASTIYQEENCCLDTASAGPAPPSLVGFSHRKALTDIERAILSEGTAGIETVPDAPPEDASTQDFLKLIGSLDEALDNHGVQGVDGGVQGIDDKMDGCPSMIFGMPIHDPCANKPESFRARTA